MIIRNNRELREPFTIIQNRIINDDRLDWDEVGLLIWLLSKPPDWRITAKHIATLRKSGLRKVRRILNNLKDCGYIESEAKHGKYGQFDGWIYTVTDTPPTELPKEQHGEDDAMDGKPDHGDSEQFDDGNAELPKEQHGGSASTEMLLCEFAKEQHIQSIGISSSEKEKQSTKDDAGASSSYDDTSANDDRPASEPPPDDDDDGDDSEIPFVYDFSENQKSETVSDLDDGLEKQRLDYAFKETGLDAPGIKKIRRENPNLRASVALAVYRKWQDDNAAGRNVGTGMLVTNLIAAGESHPGIEQAEDELYDVFQAPLLDASNGRSPAPPPETTMGLNEFEGVPSNTQDGDPQSEIPTGISAFHEKWQAIAVN